MANHQEPTILYAQPVPVESEIHGNLNLLDDPGYAFARNTNSIPIGWHEFALAARCYPIVFSAGDNPCPIAIVGIGSTTNLFVSEQGGWYRGYYVPQYVQRYPFTLIRHESRLVLCIDQAARSLSETAGEPLFVEGKPSDTLNEKLQFCGEYEKYIETTYAYAHALRDHGLLIERTASITLNSGKAVQLGGFSIIDEEKFTRLNDSIFLEWRRNGWLNLCYLHFASMGSWSNVIERAGEVEVRHYSDYVEDHLVVDKPGNTAVLGRGSGGDDEAQPIWIKP